MRRSALWAPLLVAGLLPLVTSAQSTTDTPHGEREDSVIKSFGLEISAGADAEVQVRVNDVPFTLKPAGRAGVQSLPIHGEVIPGANRIDVMIGTADIPVTSPETTLLETVPADIGVTIRLQEDQVTEPSPGTYETAIKDLEAHAWQPHVTDDGVPFPQVATLHFTAPEDHPAPIWTTAETRDVADLLPDLERAHIQIADWLRAGDAARIGVMTRRAYADAAAAYPLGGTAERRQESDVAELQSIVSDPEVAMPEIELPLLCKAYANGRMFECFTVDGEAPIQALFPGEEPIQFTFRFSVIDGQLVVVR